jgi:hypothetical protein
MKQMLFGLVLTGICIPSGVLAQIERPPQTERQALIEMLLGGPVAVEKHLPKATVASLRDTTKMAMLQPLSQVSRGLNYPGSQTATFDVGSTLLTVENENAAERVEIFLDRDDLQSDEAEMEISFRVYQNGEVKTLPFIPHIILFMRQEEKIWRLTKVTAEAEFPLEDPDFLKGIQDDQNRESEIAAVNAARTIATAEITYAATYPARGFTCRLTDLGGGAYGGDPAPNRAMLIDDQLASGERGEYQFTLGGCDNPPSSKFQVTAIPLQSDSGLHVFCEDESGSVRRSPDGNSGKCLSEGVPLQ